MLSTTIFGCSFLRFAFASTTAAAEDGYDCGSATVWSRRPRARYSARHRRHRDSHRPTLQAAASELGRGLSGLLGRETASGLRNGAIVLGTPTSSRLIAGLDLKSAGDEGYCITGTRLGGHPATVIAANHDIGVLYGVFAYSRLIQTRSLP
jgi:alpha-glucuronidase